MAERQKTTTGFEDLMSNPTGQNGFFEYLKTNENARKIFEGLLSEFQRGMGLQNQVAQVQAGNAAVAAAGFRPGQYVSERQRREAILAAADPEKAAAEKIARLRFHGGMANGKWTNSYDEWKAASKNGHGTNSRGEEIRTKSFGFSVPTARDRSRDNAMFDGGRAVNSRWARSSSRSAGGDRRGVRLGEDGSLEFHFGDTGTKTDITSGRSGAALAARRRMEMLTNNDPSNGPWMFNSPDPDRPKAKRTAFGGGKTGGFSMFSAPTNWYDWAIENSRAWERSFDRADRNLRDYLDRERKSREERRREFERSMDQSFPISDTSSRPMSIWEFRARDRMSVQDDLKYPTRDKKGMDEYKPQAKEWLGVASPRSASKGGETMRERGWLDAVFARAERAAARGGRTRR